MNASKLTAVVWLGLGLATAGLADAEGGSQPRLRFDPFARPDLSAAAADDPTAAVRAGEWAPVLNATLVAGERSLANLGGVLLAIGEETHGYRLVEVRAWEAVFDHGGEHRVLPVTAREEGS